MQNFSMLIQGFGTALTPMNIGVCMLGAVLGLIVGAMPGIGSLAGVALLLPLTYKFNPATAIIMLGALYYSNMYGGSFSAILLNIPGDSPAVCTTLDGYPMATKRKRPGQALLTANMASCIGGTIGILGLGAIGRNVAQRAQGFGMKVLAHDPFWDEAYAKAHGITRAAPDEIFAECDVISLHLPLTPERIWRD